MSFVKKLIGTVNSFFTARSAQEAAEKRDFLSKLYLIINIITLSYIIHQATSNVKETRPQRTRLFPDSWYEFFSQYPFRIETIPQMEKRYQEYKLKQLEERNELHSNIKLVEISDS